MFSVAGPDKPGAGAGVILISFIDMMVLEDSGMLTTGNNCMCAVNRALHVF